MDDLSTIFVHSIFQKMATRKDVIKSNLTVTQEKKEKKNVTKWIHSDYIFKNMALLQSTQFAKYDNLHLCSYHLVHCPNKKVCFTK